MRLALCLALAAVAAPAAAQSVSISGNVSALVDHLPNVPRPGAAGADAVTELRLRAIVDAQIEPAPWLRFRFAALADGLAADRGGSVRGAAADALEAWAEVSGRLGDLRAGMTRLAWGRLDEVQPTDVINPIDVSRYLLDGRSEARMAVPLVRARFTPDDRVTLEGVLVPAFRHGRFDRLDEETSPFNLLNDLPPPVCAALPGVICDRWRFERHEPDGGDLQGGARLSLTTGRVDWSVSGWNGFMPFGLVTGPVPAAAPTLRLVHPRYTMVGGDVETVAGKWAIRGEAAYFPDRPVQTDNEATAYEGDSFEAGAGVDRRAGDFTLSGTVLFRRTHGWIKRPPSGFMGRLGFRDLYQETIHQSLSFVGGFSRTFNRDRVETRVFSLVNPADRAAFARGVLAWKPADDVAVETSIGWFIGDGDDVITQFGDRDFAYVRVKYYFGR